MTNLFPEKIFFFLRFFHRKSKNEFLYELCRSNFIPISINASFRFFDQKIILDLSAYICNEFLSETFFFHFSDHVTVWFSKP